MFEGRGNVDSLVPERAVLKAKEVFHVRPCFSHVFMFLMAGVSLY